MVRKRHSKKSLKPRLPHQSADSLNRFHSLDGFETYFQSLGLQAHTPRNSIVPRSFMELEEVQDEGLYYCRSNGFSELP